VRQRVSRPTTATKINGKKKWKEEKRKVTTKPVRRAEAGEQVQGGEKKHKPAQSPREESNTKHNM
jgi:hypothetical protein